MIQLENKLYTSTEVASILGVSLRSVYRYLDEGSLNAEVKTATGRHRFTKQNILDFLYPDGEPNEGHKEYEKRPSYERSSSYSNNSYSQNSSNTSRSSMNSNNDSYSNGNQNMNSNYSSNANSSVNSNDDDSDVDWLSKFRAAAEKFKQEDGFDGDNESVQNTHTNSNQSQNIANNNAPKLNFYRSSLGGLKDIAQSLDKFAKETGIDYAFTLNAGLSLHKPIKPFSMLHAYVRPSDLTRLERLLSLSSSDDSNAQLCLITSDNNIIYSNKDNLHGLSVVSKSQLKQDVEEHASDLRDDLYSIL